MSNVTRRTVLNSTLGIAAAAAIPAAVQVARASDGDNVVRTSHGPVRGKLEDGVIAFRGLRYGAPPTGKLRFKPPQAPAPWTEIADASQFGAAAMQTPGPDAPATEQHSEDCLFLNVWTSSLTGKRPVMVWLHGGGFWE